MMAPCDRLSTPETPNMRVNPVAPSAYSALTAKPSIRIWSASIYIGRGSTAALLMKYAIMKMLPGNLPGAHHAVSVRCDLDEAWKLQRGLGDFRRPDRDLHAILPLQHHASNKAFAVFERMGELIVLAVELDAADGADPVGLFQRIDQLVGFGRARALHGIRDVINFVISGVAAIGGVVTEFCLEGLGERHALFRHRNVRSGDTLIEHAFGSLVGVLAEGGVGRLRRDAEHRDRNLLVLPLHR